MLQVHLLLHVLIQHWKVPPKFPTYMFFRWIQGYRRVKKMGTSTSKTSQVLDLPVYNKGYDLLKYLGWGMLKWKPTALPSVFCIMTGWVLRCYSYLLLKGYLLWPESIMRIFFEPNQSRFLSCLKFVRLERCSTLGNSFRKASWNMKFEFEIWDFSQDDLTFQVAATESVSAPSNLPRYELLYQQLVDGASV